MKNTTPSLNHIGVFTDNPKDMQNFYAAVLGLAVSDSGIGSSFKRRIIFMTGDPQHHHQFVLVVREEGDPPGGALFQVSFKVKSLDELRAIVKRAEKQGTDSLKKINHGNSWSVYFRDPDGSFVEVYLDTGWQVAQPFAAELNLDLPDDEIIRLTKQRLANEDTLKSHDEWAALMDERLSIIRGKWT